MAAVVVLSQSYSLIYSLMLLGYAVNLSGAMIGRCTNAYGTKDAHCVTKGTQTTY